MSEINFIASREIKCPECNREYQVSATDFKKVDEPPGQFLWECPKCCSKVTINYGDIPISIRDSL